MERVTYIKRVLEEHLESSNAYIQMDERSALNNIQGLHNKVVHLLCKIHRDYVDEDEMSYFNKNLKTHHRVPQFYGMPKVHKGTSNGIKLRPVISQCGSTSAVVSQFLDYKLQSLKNDVPSYIKDSSDLIHQLKNFLNS